MKFEKQLLEKVERITFTNYEAVNGVVTTDSMMNMIKDLIIYHDALAEQMQDVIEDRNENWKPINVSDMYD